MIEEVYHCLKDYGFTKDEIYSLQDENDNMFFVNAIDIKRNIQILEKLGLKKDEIITICVDNSFLITVDEKRIAKLLKLYCDELSLSKKDLKELLLKNHEILNTNPEHLKELFDYILESASVSDLKEKIKNNPLIIGMEIGEYKNSTDN